MRIAFVVPYVPNLVRVRPYNFIRYLSKRGHDVTVLTVTSNAQEIEDARQLRHECHAVRTIHVPRWRSLANCALAAPGTAPLQSAYSWHPGLLTETVMETLKPDVVHVEHLRGARYGLWAKAWRDRRQPNLPIVWDSVDSISLLFRQAANRSRRLVSRAITRLELGRTEAYEGWLTRQFNRVLVTSPADRQALAELAGPAQPEPDLRVIPNGVDLDYFQIGDEAARAPATLVMSGKMSYHANVTMAVNFAREILPRIQARRPDVKLIIVGKDPTPEVRELAQNPAVTVTGSVPDLRPHLWQATIAVAPIAYGVGIQNKVLEAMACQTPVVATGQAVSALQLRPGQDLLVANDPEAFARAVIELLEDPKRRFEVGRAGRTYVEAFHDWKEIAVRLEKGYHVDPIRLG